MKRNENMERNENNERGMYIEKIWKNQVHFVNQVLLLGKKVEAIKVVYNI